MSEIQQDEQEQIRQRRSKLNELREKAASLFLPIFAAMSWPVNCWPNTAKNPRKNWKQNRCGQNRRPHDDAPRDG